MWPGNFLDRDMTKEGRGLFFAIEGVDGSGKSTHAFILSHKLSSLGYNVVICKDPVSTLIGQHIYKILTTYENICVLSESLLFMAGRAQLVNDVIKPALSNGVIVISDRYLLSNIVYQGYLGGLPLDILWNVALWSADYILPDITFVLDLDVSEAQRRKLLSGHVDSLDGRWMDKMEVIRRGFIEEHRKNPDSILLVDSRNDIDVVHNELLRVALEKIGSVNKGDV